MWQKSVVVKNSGNLPNRSLNKRLALRALIAPSGFRKTPVGLRPLWYFATPHFANPGLAPQALIRAGKTSPTLNVK